MAAFNDLQMTGSLGFSAPPAPDRDLAGRAFVFDNGEDQPTLLEQYQQTLDVGDTGLTEDQKWRALMNFGLNLMAAGGNPENTVGQTLATAARQSQAGMANMRERNRAEEIREGSRARAYLEQVLAQRNARRSYLQQARENKFERIHDRRALLAEIADSKRQAAAERASGGQDISITLPSQKNFLQELGKNLGTRVQQTINRGQRALTSERYLRQMGQLLANADVKTGTIQPYITPLQGIAAGFGINLSEMAASMGMDLGDLSSKEAFDRLATNVIINGFQKFKGNLNSEEVRLAISAFGNLGKSEQANRMAIAAGLAAATLAQRRADAMNRAALNHNRARARAIVSGAMAGGAEEFMQLKQKFYEQLSQNVPASPGVLPSQNIGGSGVVESLPAGAKQIGMKNGNPVYITQDGEYFVGY